MNDDIKLIPLQLSRVICAGLLLFPSLGLAEFQTQEKALGMACRTLEVLAAKEKIHQETSLFFQGMAEEASSDVKKSVLKALGLTTAPLLPLGIFVGAMVLGTEGMILCGTGSIMLGGGIVVVGSGKLNDLEQAPNIPDTTQYDNPEVFFSEIVHIPHEVHQEASNIIEELRDAIEKRLDLRSSDKWYGFASFKNPFGIPAVRRETLSLALYQFQADWHQNVADYFAAQADYVRSLIE